MNLLEIESKIKTDLKKSGFLSEMKALNTFKEKGWFATGAVSFYDLDKKISRESDISAHICTNEYKDKKLLASTFFQIVAEVKKSEKPWVIFKETPTWGHELVESWTSIHFKHGFPDNASLGALTNALGKGSVTDTLGWIGTGMHEFAKNPEQPSRWYSSLVAVCKASESKLDANFNADIPKVTHPYLFFIKPVVILDAPLISASLNNGEVVLEEVKYATVDFQFQTPKYTRGKYKVDIVTLESLEEYLDLCEKRKNNMFAQVKNIAEN